MSTIEASTSRKIILHLIAPIILLALLNSLDRANISVAALQMKAQLGISEQWYGFAVGIFFAGYLLFQFPSAFALKKLGPRWWIFSVVLLWGMSATCMAFVQEAWHLYVLRFCLGLAEAGFAPGVVFLCRTWLPKRHRAKAIAATMLAIPISFIIGNPLSGWLISIDNPVAIDGWRWMFFIEGIPSIILAFAALKIFVDKLSDARWLTPPEQDWLQHNLTDEEVEHRQQHVDSFTAVLTNPRILCSAGVWFALIFGAYGIGFWLPLVIQDMTNLSELQIGFLSTLPWIGVGIGMVIVASHSDKTQERYWHVGLAAACAGLALLASAYSPWHGLSLLLLVCMGIGLGGAQGTFWTIPTSFMSKAVAANGIVLINLIGNISSLVNSNVIGLVREYTGSYHYAIILLAMMLLAAALLVFVIAKLAAVDERNSGNTSSGRSEQSQHRNCSQPISQRELV